MTMNNTIQPNLSDAVNLMRFRGVYFLVGFVARTDKNGQPYWELTLTDHKASLRAYCFDEQHFFSKLKPEQLVQVEVAKTTIGAKQFFRIVLAESAASDNLIAKYGIYSLPSGLCSHQPQLERIVELYESMNNHWLKQFLSRVLGDPFIGPRYVSCPASLRHHHNYHGGLLVHSVEVAEQMIAEPRMGGVLKELAIVAALLHDIGKVLTLTPDMSRTALGHLTDHGDLTLEVCAAALRLLDETFPYASQHLRHAWTCASPNGRYGFKAQTSLAELLQVHDGKSSKRLDPKRLPNQIVPS